MPRRTVPEGSVTHGPAAKGEQRREKLYFAGEDPGTAALNVGFRCISDGIIQANGEAVAYVTCDVDCARALERSALGWGRATGEMGGGNASTCFMAGSAVAGRLL